MTSMKYVLYVVLGAGVLMWATLLLGIATAFAEPAAPAAPPQNYEAAIAKQLLGEAQNRLIACAASNAELAGKVEALTREHEARQRAATPKGK